jgi:hypothetical protein
MFQPLSAADLSSIVHIQLRDLTKRLSDKEISLQLTPSATNLILAASYVPSFGARPLRRYLEKHVTTAISKLLIEGRLRKRCSVVITASADGKELLFDVVPPASNRANLSATGAGGAAAGGRDIGSANSSATSSTSNSPVFNPFKKSRSDGLSSNNRPGATTRNRKEEPEYMDE